MIIIITSVCLLISAEMLQFKCLGFLASPKKCSEGIESPSQPLIFLFIFFFFFKVSLKFQNSIIFVSLLQFKQRNEQLFNWEVHCESLLTGTSDNNTENYHQYILVVRENGN